MQSLILHFYKPTIYIITFAGILNLGQIYLIFHLIISCFMIKYDTAVKWQGTDWFNNIIIRFAYDWLLKYMRLTNLINDGVKPSRVWDWSTRARYTVNFPSQSATNLLRVLFPEDYQIRHLFHKRQWSCKEHVKVTLRLVQYNTIKLFKILILKLSLKILAAPLSLTFFFYLTLNIFPFSPQRFEEIATLPYYSAPDTTMWIQ